MECYSDINKKIDLLESTNVNITNSIVNPIDFVTFIEENPTSIMNFGSWKEYIIHTLSYENKIILDFLLGKKIDISKLEIWDDWKNIYLIYSNTYQCISLSVNTIVFLIVIVFYVSLFLYIEGFIFLIHLIINLIHIVSIYLCCLAFILCLIAIISP